MAGLDEKKLEAGSLFNEFAAFKAEVQCDKKDMARNIGNSSHRCVYDSIFRGKTEGVKSDTAK